MLAMRDQRHEVRASIPGLADAARITLDACQAGLLELMSPDKFSRTKDYEGRRIESVDGGWRILNAEKFRRRMSEEERKQYQAEWIRRKRSASMTVDAVDMSTDVDDVDTVEQSRVEKRKEEPPLPPKGESVSFLKFWNAYPRKVGKKAAASAWTRARLSGSVDLVLAAIELQKRSEQWTKNAGQFIPHPTTWLNQGRWDDATKTDVAPQTVDSSRRIPTCAEVMKAKGMDDESLRARGIDPLKAWGAKG